MSTFGSIEGTRQDLVWFDRRMRIAYDPDANAAYIYLSEDRCAGVAAKTYPCDPIAVGGMINLDFDTDGRLIGVEVMDADKKLAPETLAEAHQSRGSNAEPPQWQLIWLPTVRESLGAGTTDSWDG